MKNVLIIAYDFPPYNSVGALRPKSWFDHMHEFKIFPIIVTRNWISTGDNVYDYISESPNKIPEISKSKNGIIIKSPYKPNLANLIYLKCGNNKFSIIRKTISLYFEIFQYILNVGPKKEIYLAANEFLKSNRVDLILATGEPFVLFHYAKKLSLKYKTPWIADFRDPWHNNLNRGPLFKRIIFDKFLEKKIIKKALCITTVSELFKSYLKKTHPNKEIKIISNGFDSFAINDSKHIKQNKEVLNISYVGTLYKWHPINVIFETLTKVVKKHSDFKFVFNLYGINNIEEIKQVILSSYPEINHLVRFFPKQDNLTLIKDLRKSNLLLLFNYYNFMGTKIYDYLGLNRKILFCFKNDKEAKFLKEKFYNYKVDAKFNFHPQINLLEKTNSGIIIEDKHHLYKALVQLNEVFKTNKLIPSTKNNFSNYSRREQCKLLCENIISSLDNIKAI
jgi:hypothetical protein